MKITVNIPASKIKQYIALITLSCNNEMPDDLIDEILATPEVDISDTLDRESKPILIAIAISAMRKILENNDPAQLNETNLKI